MDYVVLGNPSASALFFHLKLCRMTHVYIPSSSHKTKQVGLPACHRLAACRNLDAGNSTVLQGISMPQPTTARHNFYISMVFQNLFGYTGAGGTKRGETRREESVKERSMCRQRERKVCRTCSFSLLSK